MQSVNDGLFDLKHRPVNEGDAAPVSDEIIQQLDPLRLHCTGDEVAPPELQDDLAALVALPEVIKRDWLSVLVPYLRDGKPTEREQKMLGDLCEGILADPQASLARPIRGSRFIITESARAGSDESCFVDDLCSAGGEANLPELIAILKPCYLKAGPLMRRSIAAQSVAEHGKLVQDSNWRIDSILSSEHGDGLNLPVAVLTFRYQEGERHDRITLHLLPDQLAKLKKASDRMIR